MHLYSISDQAYSTYETSLKLLGKLPRDLSVHDFITEATKIGDYDGYKIYSVRARNIIKNVTEIFGEFGVRIFLRAAIAKSVVDAVKFQHIKKLPTFVAFHHTRQLKRISEDSDLRADWLNINHDLFHKEFGIAALRLYAAGSQLIDPRCGVPRSYMFKGGAICAIPRMFTMIKLGGFRPYFQIHAHKFMLDMFNEQGREDCYRGCVELYALHPRARGMMAGSWFYDPEVAKISPHLSYLRGTPVQNGACTMFIEVGGDALHNSLATSATRRKLYQEGIYIPKNYLLLWGKRCQIAWAARTRQLDAR